MLAPVAGRLRTDVRWLRPVVYAVALLALAAAVVARRPAALLHPQFYAEDGTSWFADAYNTGPVHSLLLPLGGYYLLFQRAVAVALTPLGADRAPLAFAVIGFLCQLLPAAYFMSRRMRNVVPSDATRVVLAGLYAMVPISEVGGNLTNTQWDLAILALLVLLSATPITGMSKAVDLTVLIVSGMSGPYVLFLLPIAATRWRSELTRWRVLQISALGACAALQLGVMLYLHLHGTTRTPQALGSVGLIGLVVTNQIMATVGGVGISSQTEGLALALAMVFVLLLVIVALRGPIALKWATVFGACLAAAGVLSPYGASHSLSPWEQLLNGGGARYFYVLVIATLLSLAWLASRLSRPAIALPSLCLLIAFCAVSVTHWQYRPYYDDRTLVRYGGVLDATRSGTKVTIPIVPSGWTMTLTRH